MFSAAALPAVAQPGTGTAEPAAVIIRGVEYRAVRAPSDLELAQAVNPHASTWTPDRTPFQCDPDATPALEPPLNFPGNIWGSPAMDPYAAQGQLLDQGCFSIIGCINGIRLPAANPAPSTGPNWKVCGTIGNFLNSASSTTPSLPAALDNNNQPLTVTPASVGCPSTVPPAAPVQRDIDYIRFSVPRGGWENFRITFSAGLPFAGGLMCNSSFPAAGSIDNCWTGASSFPAEWLFFVQINSENFIVNGGTGPIINPVVPDPPEGDRDTSVTMPRVGTGVYLPEGEYLAYIAPVVNADPRWLAQGGPFAPTTPYQITVRATIPPPCGCTANLVDSPGIPGCTVNTADLSVFLGQFGKTCAQVVGTCADLDGDNRVNTADLVRFLAQFGKSSVNGVCQ
jgi:hypothetical protein